MAYILNTPQGNSMHKITTDNANLGAVQIYEDKSIFAAPLMSDDEWQAMNEEHQASQLAAESKLLAMANDIVKDIPYLSAEELITLATRGDK